MSQPDNSSSPIEAKLVNPPVTETDSASPAVGLPPDPGEEANKGRVGTDKLIQNKLLVLSCLFLVTGFLGLPLLWMNRGFSGAERIFWSVIVTIYTLILIAIVGIVLVWVYRQIAVV